MMASLAEDVMQAILGRLQGSPPIIANADNIRRSHRTPVTRANAPAVHLVDGRDVPTPPKNNCRTDRTKDLEIVLHLRDDVGVGSADPLIVEVNSRLDPENTAYAVYPHNARLSQLAIEPDEETADLDAIRIGMRFKFEYITTGWRLDG